MVACLFVNEWESMQVQNSFILWLNSNLHVTYRIFENLFDIEQYFSKYMYICMFEWFWIYCSEFLDVQWSFKIIQFMTSRLFLFQMKLCLPHSGRKSWCRSTREWWAPFFPQWFLGVSQVNHTTSTCIYQVFTFANMFLYMNLLNREHIQFRINFFNASQWS